METMSVATTHSNSVNEIISQNSSRNQKVNEIGMSYSQKLTAFYLIINEMSIRFLVKLKNIASFN